MTDLETRLSALGDHLAFDGEERLSDEVLTALRSERQHTPWLRAAAAIALIVGALFAVPDTRNAVADWFGFGAVTIERLPDDAIARADASFELAGPGDSRVDVVDGREILVSRFDARLPEPVLSKSVGTSTNMITVEVSGFPGVWIDNGPHEIVYETSDGIGVARTAGQTLLWESDGILFRIEGFSDLENALQYATTLTNQAD